MGQNGKEKMGRKGGEEKKKEGKERRREGERIGEEESRVVVSA